MDHFRSEMLRRFDEIDAADNDKNWPLPPAPPSIVPLHRRRFSQEELPDDYFTSPTQLQLINEFNRNEVRRRYQMDMADSIHTEFQEHWEEQRPTAPPEFDEYNPPRSNQFSPLVGPPINDQSFLGWFPKGNATLSYPGDDGELISIENINVFMIEARSPLLAAAFEESRSGQQLHLETLTSVTATPFLRYLYTGTYALASATGDYYEDVPTSVLLHSQLFRLGDIYDLSELKTQAYVNVLRQCEFGCSSPDKPIDLCAAIRYIYQHLREHENLTDAIVNYCISCFQNHRLAQDQEFRELAFNLRPFHQDMCRTTMKRGFEDETATAIIQMPYKPYSPETYASREEPGNPRLKDAVYHFHGGDENDESPKKRKRVAPITPPLNRTSELSLALKPRLQQASKNVAVSDDPASEDEVVSHATKRRLSSNAGSIRSPLDSDGELSSESEYEVVSGPPSVEPLTSSEDEEESDTDTLIDVPRAGPSVANAEHALPIRPRYATTKATRERSDSDSDSDWSVI